MVGRAIYPVHPRKKSQRTAQIGHFQVNQSPEDARVPGHALQAGKRAAYLFPSIERDYGLLPPKSSFVHPHEVLEDRRTNDAKDWSEPRGNWGGMETVFEGRRSRIGLALQTPDVRRTLLTLSLFRPSRFLFDQISPILSPFQSLSTGPIGRLSSNYIYNTLGYTYTHEPYCLLHTHRYRSTINTVKIHLIASSLTSFWVPRADHHEAREESGYLP